MLLMVIVRVTIVTNRAVMMSVAVMDSVGGHKANSADNYLISKP